MKGNRSFKRLLAVVMAVVFTVTGITFTPKDANAAYDWQTLPAGANTTVGNWVLFAGQDSWCSWANMQYSGAGASASDMSLKMTNPNGNNNSWGLQAKYTVSLDSSKTYTFAINYTSSAAGTMHVKLEGPNYDDTNIAAAAGPNSVTSVDSHTTVSNRSSVTVVFELDGMPQDSIVDFTGITFTEETESPGGYSWQTLKDAEWTQMTGTNSNWHLYSGSWGGGNLKYDVTTDPHISFKTGGGQQWGTQIAYIDGDLTQGSDYNYTITFNSSSTGTLNYSDLTGTIVTHTLAQGPNTISTNGTPQTYTGRTCDAGRAAFEFLPYTLTAGIELTNFNVTITEAPTESPTETTTSDGWIDVGNTDETFNNDSAHNNGYQMYYAYNKGVQYKLGSDGYTHIRNNSNNTIGDIYIGGTNGTVVQGVTYSVSFTLNCSQALVDKVNNVRSGLYYDGYNAWEQFAFDSGDTTYSFTYTPTQSIYLSNRMVMHFAGAEIPAGTEIILKGFTCTAQAATAVDVTAVTASSSATNSISASWTPGSNVPAGQVYEVYLDNEQSPRYTTADETETSKTLTGVTAGSHTVTVKSKYNDSYASAAGVTSSSVTVYDPNPVAPASVVAVDSATRGEALDVTITAAQGEVTGQTYKVYLDDTLIATETSAGTYTYDVGDLSSHTFKVSGYLATAATTESAKTAASAAASTWKKAVNSWSSEIGGWLLLGYGGYDINNYAMSYKGTTQSNLQVRIDKPTGSASSYNLQMKKAMSALCSGLTPGVKYTMTFSCDSSINSGKIKVQGLSAYGFSDQEVSVSGSKLTFTTNAFTCPASPSGDMLFLLDQLTAHTVLSNFDVSFAIDELPCPNPTNVVGAPVANTNDAITVSWNEGSGAVTGTVYDIYLDDDATPTLTGQAASASPVTINNLPASKRGTGHTVKIIPRVTVGGQSATNTGTTSSAFEIYGPIDISTIHDVVTSSTISVYWDNPANANSSQRYNVYYKVSSAGNYTTAATGITAPTSTSPLTIENLTSGTEYTVLVKAVVNSEESTGISKNITPQSVDPSWTATPASGYTWPDEAAGVGFVNSPNLYYKVGDASTGDTSVSVMSFLNANSEAMPLRILSPSYMSRQNQATTYTISLTFTSDTASAGGTWEHGLKNSVVDTTGTSSKTISSGSNTYTESISYTSTTMSNQAVNGYYYIEVPAGATIEIKSFTITSNDSLNTYLNTIQDNTWRQMAGSASGTTGKWYYKMTQNGWNHGGLAYTNAETYGLHLYNSVHRPWSGTYKTYISTGDLTSDYSIEDGRLYNVSMQVTGTDFNGSNDQYVELWSKTSYDASSYTAIGHASLPAGGTQDTITVTGQIRGNSSGNCLGLYLGAVEMLDFNIDSLTITPVHSGKTAVGDGGWHQSKDNSGNNGLWYYKLPASTAQQTYSAVYSGSGTDSSGSYTGLSVTNESTTNTTLQWATQDLKTKYSLTAGKAYTATVTLNVNNRTNIAGTAGLYKKTSATDPAQSIFATGQTIAASTDNQTITLTGPIQVNSSACCLEVVINNAYDLDFTVTNITFTALDGKAMLIPSANWERTELNSSSSAGKWYYYCANFGNDEKVVTYKNADNYGAASNGFTFKGYSPYDHQLRVATQDLVSDYSLSAGKRYTVTMVADATNSSASDKVIYLRQKASPTASDYTSIQARTVEANDSEELTFTGTVDLSSAALSLELFSNVINDLEVEIKSLTIVEETGNVADTDGTWHQSALNDGTVSGRWWYKYDETSADASGFYRDASASTYDGFTFTNEEAIRSTDGKGLLLSTGNVASQYNLVNGATYKAVVHTTVDNYDDSTGAIGLNVKTAGPDSDTGREMISDHFTYAAAATDNQEIDLSGAFTVTNNAAYLEVELGGLEGPGEDPQTINAMKVTIDSIEFYPGAHSDNIWHTCTNVDGSTTGSKWHYKDFHPDNWHIADSYANANQYEGFTWDNSVYSNGHVYFATTNLAAASAYNLADGKYYATVVLTATGSNDSGHQANTPITINIKDSTESDVHSNQLAPTQNLTYTMDETEMTFTGPVTVSNGELYLEVQMGEPKEVSKLVVTDISFDEWIPVTYGAEPVSVGDSKLWLGNDKSGNHYNFSYHNSSTGYSNLRAKITQNDAADLSTAADGYGMQVKVPNNVVYTSANNSGDALVAGASYTMTVSYTTTAAGYMRINTEGYEPYPTKQQATAAGNYTITYDFVYDPAQTTQSKYVVLMLQGFPENAIISGIDFAITGGVKPAVGASAARISRNQGTITWSDPVGMNQLYNVYINGSSTPTLSSVRAGTHTLSNIPDTAASDYTISIKATRGGDESSAVTATIGDWIAGVPDSQWHDVDGYGYLFIQDYDGDYSFTQGSNKFAVKDYDGDAYSEWGWGSAYQIGSEATSVVAGEQYAFTITVNRSAADGTDAKEIAVHVDGGTFDVQPANQTPSGPGADVTFSGTFTANSNTARIFTNFRNSEADEIFGIKNCEIVVPETLTIRNTGSAVAIALPEGASPSYTVSYVSEGQTVTGETVTAAEVTAGEHTLAAFPDNKAKVYVKDGSGNVKGVAVAEADFVVNEIKVNYDYSTGTQKQIHANTNNTVYVTVANIGTARGTAPAGYYQDFGVKAEQGNWFNTDWAFGWGEGYSYPIIVDPNGTHRFSVYGWRPVEIGNYTITATVNHEEYIPESNYGNNTRSASFTTTAQLTDSTAVLGFQLNTDTTTFKGPSYFNPSFRTVCRALKVVDVDGQMKNITGYGFVYAKTDDAAMTNLKGEMTVANSSKFTKKDGTVIDNPDGNQFINAYEARETVDLSGYTTHGSTYNSENSVFYALTFQDLFYTTSNYEQQYTFRSYLTYTDNNGQTQYVYPNDIYTTSLYEIAEDLYKYRKMKTQAAHDFLYDYVLNIIAMRDNYKSITTGIMAALGVTKQNRGTAPYNDYYAMANMNYKDMYYYAMCTNGYGYKSGNMVYNETAPPYTDDKLELRAVAPYTHDYPFQSKQIDDSGTYTNQQFLGLLNTATATSYNTVPDWIRGCIGKNVNGKDLTSYAGMYPKVSYDWDSNLDKDYGKQ